MPGGITGALVAVEIGGGGKPKVGVGAGVHGGIIEGVVVGLLFTGAGQCFVALPMA